MSRHRRSKFGALSIEEGNRVQDQALAYARAGGRPSDGPIAQQHTAQQPMRNKGAAATGVAQMKGRAPWRPMRGLAHQDGAEVGALSRGIADAQMRARSVGRNRRLFKGR